MKRAKKIIIVVSMVVMSFFLFSCGSGNKDEKASKGVVEKYFDALKYGDHDDELECYTPIVRKKEDAQFGLLGQASKLFLKVDLGEVLRNLNTLYGDNSFEELDFKVQQVVIDEEGKKGAVYVEASKDGEFIEYVRVDTVKYKGDWYVEYQSIAPDDRTADEIAALDTVEEEPSPWQNGILWIVLGSLIVIAIIIFVVILIKNNMGSRRKNSYDLPPVYTPPTGGGAMPGEILCSCGTINPVGMRTCMGCGKKLKKRR